MSYEWNSTLFQTQAEMLDAMAWAWISAHDSNAEAEIERFFAQATDAELAAEMIETWGLDQNPEITKDDLTEAFGRVRFWFDQTKTEENDPDA